MSPVPTTVAPTPNRDLSDAELREAARDAYRAALAAGQPVTGAELGRRFGLSDRWGRARVAEVRRDAAGHDRPASRDGHRPHRDTRPPNRDPGSVPSSRPASVEHRPSRPARPRRPAETSDRDRGRSWMHSVITLTVALVAGAASYGHMLHVALLAGEPLWIARAWPITVDGLVLAALLSGERGRAWLALGAAVSVASNVLAQYPDLAATAGPVIAAWPPIALYGTHRLLHNPQRSNGEEGSQQ